MLRLALLILFATGAACHREPAPVAPGNSADLPPLPPASGTPVGYLLDSGGQLALSAEQAERLQKIDASLSARNESIDTQLREIEKPAELPPPDKGVPPPRVDMAPGAQPMSTTQDAAKLHAARKANIDEALVHAFAVLTPEQQAKAKELLDARGVTSPPVAAPAPSAATPATP